MTLEELINQLNVGTGEGQQSEYAPAGSGGQFDAAYGGNLTGFLGYPPHTGEESVIDYNVRQGISPWGAGADWAGSYGEGTWEDSGAGNFAKRLASMYGYTGGGAPAGTSWQEIGMTMNPVTMKQLMGAQYGSMRPGMERGIGSLKGELLANLGRVKTGGAVASGFANRQRQAARDVYGKKAVDILSSQGEKRQDYMSSLLEQNVANQELMQSWFPAGGE